MNEQTNPDSHVVPKRDGELQAGEPNVVAGDAQFGDAHETTEAER